MVTNMWQMTEDFCLYFKLESIHIQQDAILITKTLLKDKKVKIICMCSNSLEESFRLETMKS